MFLLVESEWFIEYVKEEPEHIYYRQLTELAVTFAAVKLLRSEINVITIMMRGPVQALYCLLIMYSKTKVVNYRIKAARSGVLE